MKCLRYLSVGLATIVLMVFIGGCQAKTPPLTSQEQKTVSELTQNMQTQCIGRFLIDMPKQAIVYTGQTVGHNREVTIDMAGSMTLDEFHARMAQIETEYRQQRTRNGEIYFYDTSLPDSTIRLFNVRKNDDEPDESRLIVGYKWSNGKVIKMVAKAIDESDPKYKKDAIKLETDTPQKTALITDLLQRARARSVNEIPTEPGLCFDGGFLAKKAGDDDEDEFSATFEFPKMKDIQLDFNSYSYIQEKNTLLDRGSAIEADNQRRNGKTLRKGQLKLAGISQAEEWLSEGETDDSNEVNGKLLRGHDFHLEGNSKIGSPKTPFFAFTMSTGISKIQPDGSNTTTKSSLTDAEALALWDAVSKTIRMRPAAL